jgi:hypothetical protein
LSARIFLLAIVMVTAVLVTLRLTDVIRWSWWWVLSPLWIIALIVISIAVFALAALAAMNDMEG